MATTLGNGMMTINTQISLRNPQKTSKRDVTEKNHANTACYLMVAFQGRTEAVRFSSTYSMLQKPWQIHRGYPAG